MNFKKVSRYQKVKIRIKDENLQKNAVKVITSGKQMKGFVQKGEYYESEVVLTGMVSIIFWFKWKIWQEMCRSVRKKYLRLI